MLLSLSFNANFLASLLFLNNSVRVFHIENGVPLPCKFETMWSLTPSKMIVITFMVSFFHWAKCYAFDVPGFGIFVWLYSITPLSLSTTSIMSFQAMKFKVRSSAYSNHNPLKDIFSHKRKLLDWIYKLKSLKEKIYWLVSILISGINTM